MCVWGGGRSIASVLRQLLSTRQCSTPAALAPPPLLRYTRTYSQDSCTEPSAKAVEHPNYLVFDLDADPGESTPIRPGKAVMEAIWAAHNAKLVDIATTFRSNTSYAQGATMVGSAPCCNGANAVCRCNPT